MTIFDAIVLGIIEGVTEFLPVSSTGHLILANSLLGIEPSDFVKSFEITIQLGAISAVALLYWRRFLKWDVLSRIALAFAPTCIIGLLMYSVVKTYLLGNPLVVVIALGLGGVALILFEYLYRHGPDAADDVGAITYKQAFLIGCFQSLAIIPGVSRSAATIVGGLLTSGATRTTIVEFSFLLAVPTMLAATTLDVIRSTSVFVGADLFTLAVGFGTAFVIALLAIRFLLRFVRTHTFVPFGIYRIGLALVFFLFFLS